jgi:hypothetical protein
LSTDNNIQAIARDIPQVAQRNPKGRAQNGIDGSGVFPINATDENDTVLVLHIHQKLLDEGFVLAMHAVGEHPPHLFGR